jgi:hypothetical protein
MAVIFGAPLGVLLSIIGLVIDRNKRPALMGLALGGAGVLLFLVLTLCR